MLATGCGGSSGVVTAPNTPKQIAADKALAKAAVLRPSDLPGYKASPSTGSSDAPAAVVRKFAACTHLPEAEVRQFLDGKRQQAGKPSVDSPTFDRTVPGLGAEVTFDNNVELDRSSKDLSDPLAHFGSAAAVPCWKDLFAAAFDDSAPSGASIRDLAVSVLPMQPIGDQSAAFQASVTLSDRGQSVDSHLDLYFVRRGRAGVTLFAFGVGARVDRTLERSLLEKVLGRLGAAA